MENLYVIFLDLSSGEGKRLKKFIILMLVSAILFLGGCSTSSNITVIRNGLLFTGTSNEPINDGLVAFEGDTIIFAGPSNQYEIPAGALVLNAKGGMIMPGVIDAHTHRVANQLPMIIEEKWTRTGVTAVRCMGADDLLTQDDFEAMHQRFQGEYVLPRIVAVGPIITNYVDRKTNMFAVVTTDDEARRLGEELLAAGADQLKLIFFTEVDDQIREVLAALIDAAHQKGTRVTADIRKMSVIEAAVELGIDELAHTPLDVMSDELIASMVEKDIIMLSTLHVWQNLDLDKNYPCNVRRFLDAGGIYALGTDYSATGSAGPGMPMSEFVAMQEHGVTNSEILLAATINAARALAMDSVLGTLEPGKLADIIVVNGNPLEDINAMANLRYVIVGGHVLD